MSAPTPCAPYPPCFVLRKALQVNGLSTLGTKDQMLSRLLTGGRDWRPSKYQGVHVPYKGCPFPDDVVMHVLKYMGEEGGAARLVCKDWLRVSNLLVPHLFQQMRAIKRKLAGLNGCIVMLQSASASELALLR